MARWLDGWMAGCLDSQQLDQELSKSGAKCVLVFGGARARAKEPYIYIYTYANTCGIQLL